MRKFLRMVVIMGVLLAGALLIVVGAVLMFQSCFFETPFTARTIAEHFAVATIFFCGCSDGDGAHVPSRYAGGRAVKERDIEAHLVKRVKALDGECRKIQWIGRRGAPDRLVMLGMDRALDRLCDAIYRAREGDMIDENALLVELLGLVTVWPELKAPGVKPEGYQLREHERMRKMGQRVVVVDSIEGVEELLRG